MVKLVFGLCILISYSLAYGSKCSVTFMVRNVSDVPIDIKANLSLNREVRPDFYTMPNTDMRKIGYVTNFIVNPGEIKEADMFYYCHYEGDPEEFWINYQVSANSKIDSLLVHYKTISVYVFAGVTSRK